MISRHWRRHARNAEGVEVEERVLVTYRRTKETVYVRGYSNSKPVHEWSVWDAAKTDSPPIRIFQSADACRFWLIEKGYRSFKPSPVAGTV